MKTLSIEYCHIIPGVDNDKAIKEANKWMPRILSVYKNYKIQKCIMIDDIHAAKPVNDKFIKILLDKLIIKPNTVYLESEFIDEAREMIKFIDNKKIDFVYSKEETWLRKNAKKYKTKTEFLLNWKNNNSEIEYSCPTLAAASYLVRLGIIGGGITGVVYGDKIMASDYILNVLPSYYLSVEEKAQMIISSTFDDALNKINWFFY